MQLSRGAALDCSLDDEVSSSELRAHSLSKVGVVAVVFIALPLADVPLGSFSSVVFRGEAPQSDAAVRAEALWASTVSADLVWGQSVLTSSSSTVCC